ncbi:MAG: hypothetical protein HC852_00715 [Acaryochloridaceae cyanobacterium RU_4_10]|nr:hypothetical protein [Acaryochloridaceae cyanobacterium RU_4_10]
MQTAGNHSAKNVYPSDRGLHLEFETHEQALAFYQDGSRRGISYDIEGVTVIKLWPETVTIVPTEQITVMKNLARCVIYT